MWTNRFVQRFVVLILSVFISITRVSLKICCAAIILVICVISRPTNIGARGSKRMRLRSSPSPCSPLPRIVDLAGAFYPPSEVFHILLHSNSPFSTLLACVESPTDLILFQLSKPSPSTVPAARLQRFLSHFQSLLVLCQSSSDLSSL